MKKGFTLAEVLITLGLIGVIAVMVIPQLIVKIQKNILQVQTEHCYTQLSGHFKHFLADSGVDVLSSTQVYARDDSNEEYERALKEMDTMIKSYMKVAKVCSYEDRYDCFSDTIHSISGKSYNDFIINEKSLIYVLMNGYTFSITAPTPDKPSAITFDVNGKGRPNAGGRDIWTVSLYNDGTLNESGLTPECLKSSQACSMGSSVQEIIDSQFAKCTAEVVSPSYGAGCFGHFKEGTAKSQFKFDY